MTQPRGDFAKQTDVPTTRSIEEVKAVLGRYGCSDVMLRYHTARDEETIVWELHGIYYRITIQVPNIDDAEVKFTSAGKLRATSEARRNAADQIHRTRWRVTLLAIRAVLEWSEALKLPTVSLMLPWMVLADGRTAAEAAPEQVAQIAGRGWSALLEGKAT